MNARRSLVPLALLSLSQLLGACQGASKGPASVPASPVTTMPVARASALRAAGAPISLTASDGTGLRMVELVASAVVEDPLAFTELRLVFENPQDRVLEGTFSVTLPVGASVSRFAMRTADRWQEGEVVEKQAARRAYEDFLHRKQDPALLEQGGGNEFTARVFPIPAHGRKELIVSYSQELAGGEGYLLPLQGLPEVERLDVSVFGGGSEQPVQVLQKASYAPTGDFALAPGLLAPAGGGLRSENLVLARVQPLGASRPDPITSLLLLVDTSASRALGFEAEVALLEQAVKRLVETAGPKAPLSVGCFDQSTELVFEGEAVAFGARELGAVRARQALGASDLEQGLRWAGEHAARIHARRVVLLTDGVATAGETEGVKLGAAALRLKEAGVERLDAVATGGIRDESLLRRLVTIGLARDGVVADGTLEPQALSRKLSEATRSGLAVTVEGARWFWPRKLDGVQAGDEILVYADLPAELPVRISVSGAPLAQRALTAVPRPLLERSWVQAKINALLDIEAEAGATAASRQEIVALSIHHRVLSPYTALLVLETEADYERFQIDRRALVDILAVDRGRLALQHRTFGSPVEMDSQVAQKKDQEEQDKAERARPSPPSPPEPVALAPPASEAAAAPGAAANAPSPPPPSSPEPAGASPPRAAWAAGPAADATLDADGRTSPRPLAPRAPPAKAPRPAPKANGGDGPGVGSIDLSGSGGLDAGRPLGQISGVAAGQGQGFGSGHGQLGGAHRAPPPRITESPPPVRGNLPPEVIRRVVRQHMGAVHQCYEAGLRRQPSLRGRLEVRFVIDRHGAVSSTGKGPSTLGDDAVARCIVREFARLVFPAPDGGIVEVRYPLTFTPGEVSTPTAPPPPGFVDDRPRKTEPYAGPFKGVMDLLASGDRAGALRAASDWRAEAPGDVMALVALGEACEAGGDAWRAARAYGSIIDLFSSRADLRRFAGERLERIGGGAGQALAIDSFRKAVEQRPDHPSSHRLLAFALLRKGDHEAAFAAGAAGAARSYPPDRFRGVDRILREDLGLIAAAWQKAEPARAAEIAGRLLAAGGTAEEGPSLRFVLTWETDANDVDFHIFDARGEHAYYRHPQLPDDGGELYADVTTGYGPECFTIRKSADARSAAYTLQANYYSRGPMGYGMGKLEIIDHDGKGGLTFEERPYVVMVDHAFVDLGSVKR